MNDSAVFTRGFLTDQLNDMLESSLAGKVLVGDGIAPLEGGWSEGQPGEGEFRTYITINAGPARANNKSPLGMSNDSWLVDYSVRAVGGNRQQADWAADRFREALVVFPSNYGDPNWRVIKRQFVALGAAARNDQVDPPYWELVDSVGLWVERS